MSANEAPPGKWIQVAEESYRRCQGEAFFQSLYQRLLASDAAVRAKFARTDFSRQNKLLQHGLGLLLIYAKRPNPAMLERIAVCHGQDDLDVPPTQYPLFVDSLIAAVREHDPQCTPDVENAWRTSLAPGIAFMAKAYDVKPTQAASDR